MKRKYWIGWSDAGAHRPDDFKAFTCGSEEELNEIQASAAELMATDWLNEEGIDDEDTDTDQENLGTSEKE